MNWQSKRDVHQMGIVGGVTNNGEAPDDSFYSNLLNDNLEGLSSRELVAVQFAKAMGTEPQKLAKDEKFWAEVKEVLAMRKLPI